MNSLNIAIKKIFKGAIKSFSRFPASIISAIIISITAIVRIRMSWETQETYDFLFNSIQLSFLLGAVFSMAAVAFEETRLQNKKTSFLISNLSGILVAIISLILLYFFGGRVSEGGMYYLSTNSISLSSIAIARMNVAIFISLVAFIYLVSKSRVVDSFSDSFFIFHKAFVISGIYGLVIMGGVSGVLGAFKALVYRGMSNNVYQYLGVAVGLLTYTMFLGYFPSFKDKESIDEIKIVEEQPRFIFILFEYILVPIIMALTVVLLIWSVKVVLSGVDVSFNRLSTIASTYVILGIWLHIMVDKHTTNIAKFYKTAYPFAGILILIFQAWALFVQISKFGLKTAEYSFIMIWIFAIISLILLILLKDKAYRKMAIVAMVISIIWVLPIIGYADLTFNSQVKGLEELLIDEGFLINDNITIPEKEVEQKIKSEITDKVDFLSYSEKTNTPSWFKEDLNEYEVFKDTFGFKKTYGLYLDEDGFMGINFILETDIIDISDYSLNININSNEETNTSASFQGKDGEYEVIWENKELGIPKITVKFQDNIIIEEDLEKYLLNLLMKHPQETEQPTELPLEDMSIILEGENLSILLVFDNIDAYFNTSQDRNNYYMNFQGIYVKFK